MKTWQSILNGGKSHSNIIRKEIETLTNSGQKMESELVELENSLKGLHKDLLAESPGALEAVRAAESNIRDNRNKLSAISRVTEDLQAKLAEALLDERKNRLAEIIAETKIIDDQAAEKRLELVETYAKACTLFIALTGQEVHSLDYDYFVRYGLDKPLQDRIQELEPDGMSLYRTRQALSSESAQLHKKSI